MRKRFRQYSNYHAMKLIGSMVLTVTLAGLAACSGTREVPAYEYMANMMDSPAIKAQEQPMRRPPAGTEPIGFIPYPFTKDQGDLAGRSLTNPLPRTLKVFKRGASQFNTYCAVCHGHNGAGKGSIVPKFPQPPALFSKKVVSWPDGRIFHVITRGQNLMPAYDFKIAPDDRWAIVHYVRALQRAANPTDEDLKRFRRELEQEENIP